MAGKFRVPRKVPARSCRRVTVTLEPSLWKRLQLRAESQKLSLAATAEKAIQQNIGIEAVKP